MERAIEQKVIRLLQGELKEDEARQLRQRLAANPREAARFRELEHTWQALELPAATVPIGFAQRVVTTVESRASKDLRWAKAPAWARAGVAAALLFGVCLGAGLHPARSQPETVAWVSEEMGTELADPMTLAESYWLMLEDVSTTLEEEST